MKFRVFYSRKVKAGLAYEMLEIGLSIEFDTANTHIPEGFRQIRGYVDEWIEKEKDRLLKESVKRP